MPSYSAVHVDLLDLAASTGGVPGRTLQRNSDSDPRQDRHTVERRQGARSGSGQILVARPQTQRSLAEESNVAYRRERCCCRIMHSRFLDHGRAARLSRLALPGPWQPRTILSFTDVQAGRVHF